MSKYRVPMANKDISSPDKVIEVIAVSAMNAQEIANTFNKNYSATKAIRLYGTQSTLKDLENLHREKTEATKAGKTHCAVLAQEAIDSTVSMLKGNMNIVAFNSTKKHIDFVTH